MLINFFKEYLPMCPPFVGLVGIYLLANLIAYTWSRERGYIISGLTGGLFLVPFFMHR